MSKQKDIVEVRIGAYFLTKEKYKGCPLRMSGGACRITRISPVHCEFGFPASRVPRKCPLRRGAVTIEVRYDE